MDHLTKFLSENVPRIANKWLGPGHEASFRQEFLEGIKVGLENDGLLADIRLEESTLAGRTDARIEFFLFELKSPGELSKATVKAKGITALREYLESKPKENWAKYRGLLTDGIQAAILAYHPNSSKFAYVDASGSPLPTGRELMPWSEVVITLGRIIPTMALPHLSSESLLLHFGLGTPAAKNCLKALWEQLDEGKSEFTKLLYSQWRELFALAVEFSVTDKPGEDMVLLFQMGGRKVSQDRWDEAVFVIHTYYSLILKLLALRIVDELGLVGRVSLLDRVGRSPSEGLIEAEASVPKLLGNVIEKDVFSWSYCDVEWPPTNEVKGAISELAKKMQNFDVQGVKTDVLRRVYQNIIPPKLRKSLGEFYTPTWAAELVLDQIRFEGKGRILDPTCGSGTFLVAAIQRVLENAVEESIQSRLLTVTKNVVGYDVNPIAVATSRLNYTLSLVDTLLASSLTEPLAIPVFLADSLLLPELESVGLSPYFKIRTRVGIFQVPILFPEKKGNEIVGDTSRLLRLLRTYSEKELDAFLSAVRKEFGAEAEENNRQLLSKIHKTIHTFQIDKRDGIWASIIENFFAPALQGRFEFVVGNPPWVIPRRTPGNYTSKVREVASLMFDDRNVLEPAKKDFVVLKTRSAAAEKQYFACTPFVWRALRTYVEPGGNLAFLMTSSMLSSISAGGWRKWVSRFQFQKLIDMTLVTDIHEGALSWSYVPIIQNQLGTEPFEYSFCVPTKRHGSHEWDLGPEKLKWFRWKTTARDLPVSPSKILLGESGTEPSEAPWIVASPNILQIVRKIQKRATKENDGPNRLGDLYPLHMGLKADGWKHFAFDGTPKFENGVARGTSLAGENITVEDDFVFCTAVASSLKPWGFTPNFAFLPLDGKGNDVREEVLRKHSLSWQYLMDHKRLFSARAVVKQGYVNDWFGILVPEAAKSSGKVAFRLISPQLESSILPGQIRLESRKRLLLPDQSVRFIPLDDVGEAQYLAGIMNSSILRCIAYLCSTPKGGVPWRAFKAWNVGFIPVIRFDSKNSVCQEISSLANKITKDPKLADENQDELDLLVARHYGITKDEANDLKNHLLMMQGNIQT